MRETPRRWAPVFILAVAAFFAVLPLAIHGCSCGHDFDFHLVNWLEANAQFRHGNFHPHWAFTAAWGSGEPRFVFYPPLSWTIGGLLGFVMSFTAVPIAYTWLCLFLAGLTSFRLAKTLGAPRPSETWVSVVIAVIYLASPYILFTAYERTAYAELLAAAWMPLLLTALLRARPRALEIAIPIALLWLTNAPAAVIGCYSLLFIGLIRLVLEKTGRLRLVARLSGGTVLGIALAGFYIIPAAYERRWVQVALAIVEGVRPQDNFLFGHTADPLHDIVLWQASRIAAGLLVFILMLVVMLRKNREAHILGAFTLIVALLLLPISMPIWSHAPQLAFLQFPWRFLSMLQTVGAALLALALPRIRMPQPRAMWAGFTTATAFLIAFTLLATHFYCQGCDEEDAPQAHIDLFRYGGGVLPTDEYTVQGADNDLLAQKNPAWWWTQTPNDAVPDFSKIPGTMEVRATVTNDRAPDTPWNSEHPTLTFHQTAPAYLVINRRAFPAWQLSLNGKPASYLTRPDGLMALPLVAGPATVQLDYKRTPDQTLGQLVSAIAFLLACFLYRRNNSLSASWRKSA